MSQTQKPFFAHFLDDQDLASVNGGRDPSSADGAAPAKADPPVFDTTQKFPNDEDLGGDPYPVRL